MLPLLVFSGWLLFSCSGETDHLSGWWEATFSDSIRHPRQYLYLEPDRKGWRLASDEPAEDWYNIPGENLFFQHDSLYYERFWGLEKYSAKFSPDDSAFHGLKQLSGKPPIPFTMRKILPENLNYKIPQVDQAGKPILKYHYRVPDPSGEDWKCSSLAEAGMDSSLIVVLMNKILSQEIPDIHSLLILKDDQLVLEEYFHGYSRDRLHRVHSVTKSFTSALLGIAIDKGLIPDDNEPVWKYFAERDSTRWVKEKYDIRIKHLLSMTAGLDWKGLTPGESNDDMDMYKTHDYFGFLLNKELKFSPGTHFCYNNGLSLMLGHILEKSSGLSVEAFANETLFAKPGITDYAWDVDDNGITRTDGGLKLRPLDMLKFGQLYLSNGKWKEDRIISENWIHYSTGQKIGSNDAGYAFHWWIRNYKVNNAVIRTIYALGHGEQAIILVPEFRLVFVMTAGNYLQTEHRPFEILQDYILPSLQTQK
ncbi:MAG TPA: serine hydrolase [Prolixibacteraceae bacterium]|nr:serine hydrolase [Prolixibacteraceae bacterium]